MAAWGESDSVITHATISEELQVSLLLLSISLRGGRGFLLRRVMLLFSAQYHKLCITSFTGELLQSSHRLTQRIENGE